MKNLQKTEIRKTTKQKSRTKTYNITKEKMEGKKNHGIPPH